MVKKKPTKSSKSSSSGNKKPAAKSAPKAPSKVSSKPSAPKVAPVPQPKFVATPPRDPQAAALPRVSILAQYVKDLSFENPNAPRTIASRNSPKMDINVDLRAQPIQSQQGHPTFEIVIKLVAKASQPEGTAFLVDLTYAGVFALMNIPQKDLEATLLVYCPNLLFPFARQVIAGATRDGGFPPLMLEPIDFGALYLQRKRAQQPPQA
ncbi:MAG: protein-export chaperone SecB [Proteobacteria bacterium]|nr:protein-export chaperone SecB [Pseudomonadota bacterium]